MAGINTLAHIMDLTPPAVNLWVGLCSVVMLEFLIKPKHFEVLSCKNHSSISIHNWFLSCWGLNVAQMYEI